MVLKTLIFLRHAQSEANVKNLLTGRLPGIGLSARGEREAKALTSRIGCGIDYLHISPMERCHLTIAPWLKSRDASALKTFQIVDEINEIDFGSWSGRNLSTLRRNRLWSDVQIKPSVVRFPNGESFRQAQRRSVAHVQDVLNSRGNATHLFVTHSDIIKLITSSLLGMKLDNFQSIQVDPASFTVFSGDSNGQRLITLNNSSPLTDILK